MDQDEPQLASPLLLEWVRTNDKYLTFKWPADPKKPREQSAIMVVDGETARLMLSVRDRMVVTEHREKFDYMLGASRELFARLHLFCLGRNLKNQLDRCGNTYRQCGPDDD